MKAIEGAIYCQSCAAKLPHRTPKELALRFPASHDKSKCHGAKVYSLQGDFFKPWKADGRLYCSECHKPCEVKEERGTCRGCGNEVRLREASKVIRREVK